MVPKALLLWEMMQSRRTVALVGDPGCGKTTCYHALAMGLQMWAREGCEHRQQDSSHNFEPPAQVQERIGRLYSGVLGASLPLLAQEDP
eukprot:7360558-Pyramimonas_sp.AAC.2